MPQPRAWNSQRGPQRPTTASDAVCHRRNRLPLWSLSTGLAVFAGIATAQPGDDNGRLVEPSQLYALTSEALYFLPLNLLHRALPAGSDTMASPTAPPGSSAQTGRGPTRKSPTPRPGVNGRYRYLWLALRTPPCGIFVSRICRPKTPTPRPGSGSVPRRRPPSARKENGARNGRPSNSVNPNGPRTPSSGGAGMGSARLASVKPATRKTPRATPRRERPPPAGMASPQPMPIS